jgi:amidohydrolase
MSTLSGGQNFRCDCLCAEEVARLAATRQQLHRHPELSGQETNTALFVQQYLLSPHHSPSGETPPGTGTGTGVRVLSGVGGTGVVAVFDSGAPGPAVLFRAELDALPIEERNDFIHKSEVEGVSHKCGHDGHCATLLGLSGVLQRRPLLKGKVFLLFQPAEETGEGAEQVLQDAVYQANVTPDFVFAFHNIPGML